MSAGPVSAAEHKEISSRIRERETATSGEIFAVIAGRSSDYFFVAGFFAGLWAIALGCAIALAVKFWRLDVSILTVVLGQLAGYVSLLLAFHWFPGLRMGVVPRPIAWRRASDNAQRQFLAHGVHQTKGRTGVLLFVSLAERYAEVVADSEVDAVVDQSVWNETVELLVDSAAEDRLAEGFLKAIDLAGGVLAKHFPPGPDTGNELDDRLVEI